MSLGGALATKVNLFEQAICDGKIQQRIQNDSKAQANMACQESACTYFFASHLARTADTFILYISVYASVLCMTKSFAKDAFPWVYASYDRYYERS